MSISVSDVETSLSPIIGLSPLEDGTKIINLDSSGNTFSFVQVDTFVSLFANSADMTAASLQAVDAGKMGYSTFIDRWKQSGYIS